MTADVPWGEANVLSTTHEIEEFCTVVQSELADHSILLKVEIDGMHSDHAKNRSADPSRYVEMKTMWKYPRNRRINNFRRRKYMEHWAHAFIAGVEDNVYGLKDDNGIVTEVEVLKTHQLPRLSENFWYPEDLIHSLDSFLTLLKNAVTQDNPNVVYKFDCTPEEIKCTEMCNPEEKYKLIPEWYVREYNENF
ncbi:decapping and exoribonuclease protein-like [Uloborus diversus]|uniref:decapping and exoribonuclease protein-like n=1 Tax=Uloborus diversus TaxID=327109 RepID=UPI002408FC3F|nr:decapping and exoribonuclease protein-like [Uloborus diversus]XP_054718791.1 decapping and exoribonuclease protein-like [Uloborus diversus]